MGPLRNLLIMSSILDISTSHHSMHLDMIVKYTSQIIHFLHFLTQRIKILIKKKKKYLKFQEKKLKKEAGVPQFYRTSQYRHLSEGIKTFASVSELVSLSNNLFIRKHILNTFQQQKLPYKIKW